MNTMSSRGWLLLALCCGLALSGCLAVTSDDDPDADTVIDRVERNMNETQAFEARLVQRQEIAGETTEMEAIVAYEAPGKMNVTYLSPERFAGTRIVSNGSTTLIYNPNSGTASIQQTDSGVGENASASGLFFGLSSVGNGTTIENTATTDDAVSLSYAADGQQFSLFVGGTPDRQSRLTNDSNAVETTVWIDRDRWLPTKAELNYTNLREPMVQTIEYRNFTTVEDLPDERFSTDPPADARLSEGLLTPFMG
jgi:outer membrane lipoprotein-sorting protein